MPQLRVYPEQWHAAAIRDRPFDGDLLLRAWIDMVRGDRRQSEVDGGCVVGACRADPDERQGQHQHDAERGLGAGHRTIVDATCTVVAAHHRGGETPLGLDPCEDWSRSSEEGGA